MLTPGWFLKELKIIDPTYYVRFNESNGFFEIVKDVSVSVKMKDGGTAHIYGPRIVDAFLELTSAALDNLRRRKAFGRQLNIVDNPMAELEFYAKLQKEANAKMMDEAYTRMAEGFKDIVEIGTGIRKSYSYGGKDGK